MCVANGRTSGSGSHSSTAMPNSEIRCFVRVHAARACRSNCWAMGIFLSSNQKPSKNVQTSSKMQKTWCGSQQFTTIVRTWEFGWRQKIPACGQVLMEDLFWGLMQINVCSASDHFGPFQQRLVEVKGMNWSQHHGCKGLIRPRGCDAAMESMDSLSPTVHVIWSSVIDGNRYVHIFGHICLFWTWTESGHPVIHRSLFLILYI